MSSFMDDLIISGDNCPCCTLRRYCIGWVCSSPVSLFYPGICDKRKLSCTTRICYRHYRCYFWIYSHWIVAPSDRIDINYSGGLTQSFLQKKDFSQTNMRWSVILYDLCQIYPFKCECCLVCKCSQYSGLFIGDNTCGINWLDCQNPKNAPGTPERDIPEF